MTSNFSLDNFSILNKINNLFQHFNGGELFIQKKIISSLIMQNAILKNINDYESFGFGLRAFINEKTAFFSSSIVNNQTIMNAISKIEKTKSILYSENNTDYINVIAPHNNIKTNTKLDLYKYNTNFIEYNKRIELLNTIHEYITNIVGAFANISDITIVLGEQLEHVNIFKIDNVLLEDSSPMCSLRISITASNKKGKSARSSSAGSGRFSIIKIMDSWKLHADHAIHEIRVNLEAVDAFAGLMTVVLGAGTPGIMIHEAVGHGLEADFNRKGTSVFSGKIGEKIAHEKVTIVDNATIPEKRGSKNFDDEGTISQNTILIENGILKGYMYDTLNASLMHKESTGNGRRESYAHIPYPRMTNTYMLAGSDSKEDIIKSVKKGIYIKSLSSGQVDITSGQFVFSTSEAYAIENGIITYPVKGVTLIGSGSEVLKNVSMVGNDFELYTGAGMCGKNGQSVPVGVGQPTIKVDNITVGGTNI